MLRWVNDDLQVREDFIGLYELLSLKASVIVDAIKDTLLRLNLPLSDARGQCYDGAANISGKNTGIAQQLLAVEPKCTYTPCYGHALSL